MAVTAAHKTRAWIGAAALFAWVVLVVLYRYGLLGWGALAVLTGLFVYSLLRFERAAGGEEYDRDDAHHYAKLFGWVAGALIVAILVVL